VSSKPLQARTWIECPDCGEDVIGSDERGCFGDGDEAVCGKCGARVWLSIDAERGEVYWESADEMETE
jgi:predicted RNA-binding Zn-ribbon protein involved in translation (DUF1610 family)